MPLSPHRRRALTPVTPASTFAVNPSNTPRTNLNNPEQIRTNPNTAKHLDQIGPPPGSPPNAPKKRNPNTIAAPAAPAPSSVIPAPLVRHSCAPHPSFLRRQEPAVPPSATPAPSSVIPACAGTTLGAKM